MRPGQQNKRGRGRNNNNNNNNNNNQHRKGGNPLTRTYDSSGPDVKIRGTAQHIAEKYAALARDAQSAGDRVMAENYLQHAEHYNRIIAAAQAQMQDRFPRDERSDNADRTDFNDRDGFERDSDEIDSTAVDEPAAVAAPVAPAPVAEQPVIDGTGPQPIIEGTPAEVSLEDEAAAPTAGRAPSRRRSTPRPRRPRRGEAQAAGDEAQPAGDEAPALEASE
ncbi:MULTISPECIES: DUF4167 domain-containing protein [unclassified Shinella]|uniref:DUF4167 domain-containing protein n=1 Tax=unclassified Shinella TaxID=2643062 RepID=UPI00225D639D|nr:MULTISPECIES: DUF4167 domain-containing protein [unclassified Shinella]MCO5139933.1 DUF4167 domain-containing protein [Shinella sp.]MDC7257052.1 DUF4167 domain-containing protein [Shinella sp. YE25]CAI0339916.1 Eukaryotic translation initiation factor 3 subunit 10 [Rhizobiaceae bacterium]CAK7258307.1 DUF4167 domain-containing protein [Shinella sp. WSC3-e]